MPKGTIAAAFALNPFKFQETLQSYALQNGEKINYEMIQALTDTEGERIFGRARLSQYVIGL